ncbi:hypothetical protein HMPREF1982_02673 [Clostridiales bacterium oral taxon 876 str. F0540]|nr:hypothetical protein HMPREF1982_02673 [Clostridiales bacterium oral taxon 876 str. F0540]
MLSKNVFIDGIERLVLEYKDKGFDMTKEKAEQWYSFMKNMSESEFNRKIDNCLMTCRRSPTMADVLDIKDNPNETQRPQIPYI